jgi:uroporphyrinogen-III decarboxylase
MVDIAKAREELGPDTAILRNINPVSALRNSTPERIQQDLACCRRAAGKRYIVGAGCEIPRGTLHGNVRALSAFALIVQRMPIRLAQVGGFQHNSSRVRGAYKAC